MKTKRHRPSRNIIITIALGIIIIITIFIITILATIITITRVVAGLLLSNLMSLLLGAGIGICIYRRFLSIFDVVVSLIWTWKDILKPRSWRLFSPGPGRAIWTCDYSDSVIPCNICCQMLAEFNTVTQIHCSILQRNFICQGDRRNLITKIEHLKKIRPCSSGAWANQAKLYQTNKTQPPLFHKDHNWWIGERFVLLYVLNEGKGKPNLERGNNYNFHFSSLTKFTLLSCRMLSCRCS